MIETVTYVTSHGSFEIRTKPGENFLAFLFRNGIPWSGISCFKKESNETNWTPIALLHSRPENFKSTTKLAFVNKRNIRPAFDFFNDIGAALSKEGNVSSEFLYINPDDINSYILKQLSPEECKKIVEKDVHDTLKALPLKPKKIVVGISGGGDSNSLIHSLTSFENGAMEIVPVMLLGAPEWDLGEKRAKILCDKYGLNLRVIPDEQVRQLVGIKSGKESAFERFQRIFSGDDFEFMGTILIRLVLTKIALEEKADYICTGANLEDVLADTFYCLTNFRSPLPRPVVPLHKVPLVQPLWLTPKKIIDGCYPNFSLENYQTRPPCVAEGRSKYYQMALTFQSSFPGMAERLVRTSCSAEMTSSHKFDFDKDLDFQTLGTLSDNLKRDLENYFCKKSYD